MRLGKRIIALLGLTCATLWLALSATNAQATRTQPLTPKERAQIALGKRLFHESRFSTPKGDLPASCSTCHLFNEDPQGLRAYADFFNRSWFSHRPQDPRRLHARNSPVLFDVALQPSLHFDGEFPSLEALVKGTFAGRPMGWLPGEETEAYAQLHKVLLNDGVITKAGSYRQQFKQAYATDLTQLSDEACAEQAASAVAVFLRTLHSPMESPYDQFIRANQLSEFITGKNYQALLAHLDNAAALKLTASFDAEALRGMQIFFRSSGETAVGNCVTCHTPPLFTDFSFHNVGVSQAEYDATHGEGSFAKLSLPAANAPRPVANLRLMPERKRPELADLGHWNFVNLKTSPLRKPGESDDQFLARMVATFKTPMLRHLAYSSPYLHNGVQTELSDTLREKIRLSELARAGQLRAADEELLRMHLSEAEIAPLVKFLNALSEALKLGY